MIGSAYRVNGWWFSMFFEESIRAKINAALTSWENRFSPEIEERIQDAEAASQAFSEHLAQKLREELEFRVQLAIDEAIAFAHQSTQDILHNELKAIRQHIPQFLNAAASVPALSYKIVDLQSRMDVSTSRDTDQKKQIDQKINFFEAKIVDEITECHNQINTLVSDLRSHITGIETRYTNDLTALQHAIGEGSAEDAHLWKANERVGRETAQLWNRIEFVRKEIMYESRYGAIHQQPVSRIVNEAALEKARLSALRLNLGCGHRPIEGYINVDCRDLPGIDIVADVGSLPIEKGTVSEIMSEHLLEHFPQERLRRLLSYWHELLKKGGEFRAVVPDGEAMLSALNQGNYSFEDFRMVLFGAQEYEGDFHFNLLTPDTLGRLLTEAGFRNISFPARARKNDICFEFEIKAKS